MKTLLVCILASVALAACDSTNATVTDDLLVVKAFLFAGEPVDDIFVSKAIALTSEDTLETPIADATVTLTKGAATFALTGRGDGSYGYDGTDLIVSAGDAFALTVMTDDQSVTAETLVPTPPMGGELSDTTLEVSVFDEASGGGFRGAVQSNTITLTWSNPDASLYYVVVESIQTSGDPEYILPEFVRDRFAGFQLVTEPTDLDYYDVNSLTLEVLGAHRAIIYRVNDEYADLYENREQDSRDLNEPPTNIVGGLGVFSAFNSLVLTFEVVGTP